MCRYVLDAEVKEPVRSKKRTRAQEKTFKKGVKPSARLSQAYQADLQAIAIDTHKRIVRVTASALSSAKAQEALLNEALINAKATKKGRELLDTIARLKKELIELEKETSSLFLKNIKKTQKTNITKKKSFAKMAQSTAKKFVASVDKDNIKSYKTQFAIDAYSNKPKLKNYISQVTLENVQLIKSVPEKHLSDLAKVVEKNFSQGASTKTLEKILQERFDITKKRAKFIAVDQTAKIAGNLGAIRQVEAGFKAFRWLTSKDQRVRSRHKEFAERKSDLGVGVFLWSDLPVDPKTGRKLKPSDDYRCRCVAIPTRIKKTISKNSKNQLIALKLLYIHIK